MRNDARPLGETAQRDRDPRRQEQAIERSPGGASRPAEGVVDEHAASSNAQDAGGLTGGSPDGGPRRTPERIREEEKADERADREETMPTNDSTLRTKI